jgi:outer membrane protein assembly factor BamB
LSLNYLDGRIVLVAENGVVSALAAATGETQWSKKLGALSLAAVRAVGTEIMFATAEDHRLHILDVSDGREVASVDTGHAVTALSTVGDDLIWGDERGSVVRYDRGEGSISWRYRNGARISSIVEAGDHVIAASLDNFIYSIADSTGRVRWKKRLPARVLDRPLVDKELGIVLTFGEPNAALINMENGKLLGRYSVNDDESFLQPPIAASGSYIFFTNRRVLLHRRGECPK